MDVGLADVKNPGMIPGKYFRKSGSDTGVVLTGYIYQNEFKIRRFHIYVYEMNKCKIFDLIGFG